MESMSSRFVSLCPVVLVLERKGQNRLLEETTAGLNAPTILSVHSLDTVSRAVMPHPSCLCDIHLESFGGTPAIPTASLSHYPVRRIPPVPLVFIFLRFAVQTFHSFTPNCQIPCCKLFVLGACPLGWANFS